MRTGLFLLIALPLLGGLARGEDGAPRVFTDEDRAWWAIQEVRDPHVPGDESKWARNEVDRFVIGSLRAAGLEPAPAAGRRELVRRAYFDLHGLPPTPQQVESFLGDGRPDAWERLVDELLESPRYGERWGQHWMDVVRFAESDGYRQDAFRPDAFRYRDWVIKSFNTDKPYDKFVAQQLAGDEIDADDPDSLIGTAFLRNGLYEYNQRDVRFQWELILNELTNVTGEAFLGLGIGCAQCHDHKFDPLLQKDYYRLQAYLAPVRWRLDLPLATPAQRRSYEERQAEWERVTADLRRGISEIIEPKIQKAMKASLIKFPEDIQALFEKSEGERSPYEEQLMELAKIQVDYERERFSEKGIKGEEKERLDALRAELATHDHLKPAGLPRAFVATDVRNRPPVVPLGGRPGVGVGNVMPGQPSIIDAAEEVIRFESEVSSGRRLALASWITDPKNPLTARVMVNRLWQHHFARGIVNTPNDFGTLGEPPSHPELLDWLATRLVKNGWRMKELHRLMMNSATYRQTARVEPVRKAMEIDPENRLLWRYPPRRLDAEQARDAMLAASGELDLKLGGPSVEGATPRRSIYVKKIRNSPDELLKGFDAPMGFESTAARTSTTTATQSLQLINGEWMSQRSVNFARRILGKRKEIVSEDIARAYRVAFGREASAEEVVAGLAFILGQKERMDSAPTVVPPKAPGFRPIALQFGSIKGITFGKHELQLQPSTAYERLHLKSAKLTEDEFSIETVTILDSLYPSGEVRTLASRWNGKKTVRGWTFGVTSEKSAYQPRNFIMQLIGRNADGVLTYEVVPSNLRVPLGVPVYLAATVSVASQSVEESGGQVTFSMKDLSDPQAPMQTATIPHSIVKGLQDPATRIILGGRDQAGSSLWDGEVARFALREGALEQEFLLFADRGQEPRALLDVKFDGDAAKPVVPGAEWLLRKPKAPAGPPRGLLGAVSDFCHALLTSNEFLYLH